MSAGEGVEKLEPSYTVWWECKMRGVWLFLKELYVELAQGP